MVKLKRGLPCWNAVFLDGISYFFNGQRVSAEEAYVYQQLGGTITTEQTYLYHSPGDLALYGNTIVLNRVGGAMFSNWSPTGSYYHTYSDMFLRFFSSKIAVISSPSLDNMKI